MGADKLSDYFKLIRMDTHIGSSPSTVLRQLQTMEGLLPEFQTLCENQVESTTRESVVAMDETFFGDFLILVLMDLRSGYLILENVATDRCFDTWFTHVEPRLKSLGIHVRHAVTDRAKALIKLAITGFGCESGADLFHAQQDAVRWLGASLGRRLSNAEKQQAVASESGGSAQAEQNVASIKESKLQYHENLQGLSEDLHPFSLLNNQPQTEGILLDKLEKRVRCFEEIAKKQAIPDNNKTAKKLRNQIPSLAVNVTAWWLWVNENLQALKVDAILRIWIIDALLPVVYWHHQLHKTQNTLFREKCQQAWESSSEVLRYHPLTYALSDCKLQHWLSWAEWMVQHFHRSSSAVEGRNGCLSKMYHNGRGISESRLKALTVIHNYGLKRQDGTTAAQRFFEQDFPDLFSWILDRMGELPLPRKGRPKVVLDPLKLLGVSA